MNRLGKVFGALLAGCGIALVTASFVGHIFAKAVPKFVYVADYYSSDITAYSVDSSTGALTPVDGSPFAAGQNPFAVTVDPSGKFVYAVNYMSNEISAYAIDNSTGALAPVSGSPFAA